MGGTNLRHAMDGWLQHRTRTTVGYHLEFSSNLGESGMAAVEDAWLLRKFKNGSGIIHFLIQRNHHGTVVVSIVRAELAGFFG